MLKSRRNYTSWDEILKVVNTRWKELDLSYSEVFEALGWKDYFDFV